MMKITLVNHLLVGIFLQSSRISMELCIFHGNSFQNGFPEFAHILQVEFLTVCTHRASHSRVHRTHPRPPPHVPTSHPATRAHLCGKGPHKNHELA